MDINNINVLVLAYLGDNVYEYYVRRYLISKNIPNVDLLQKESINYVPLYSFDFTILFRYGIYRRFCYTDLLIFQIGKISDRVYLISENSSAWSNRLFVRK